MPSRRPTRAGSRIAPRGKLVVVLSADPNPDYDRRMWEGVVSIRATQKVVADLREASRVARAFIAENRLGGGNWSGGQVYDDTGSEVAYVSYNGRVWEPDGSVEKTNPSRSRNPATHPLDPDTAFVSFLLVERVRVRDARGFTKMLNAARKNLSSLFGAPILVGYTQEGAIACDFRVESWADVKAALDAIKKHDIGSDRDHPEVEVGVPGNALVARDFRLYPDRSRRDIFYGPDKTFAPSRFAPPGLRQSHPAAGTWEEWLKANKPAAARKNPSRRYRAPVFPQVGWEYRGVRIRELLGESPYLVRAIVSVPWSKDLYKVRAASEYDMKQGIDASLRSGKPVSARRRARKNPARRRDAYGRFI